MQKSIIDTFSARVNKWITDLDNSYFSAIERQDILYVSCVVKSVLLDMIQIIFAINKEFFNGDKKIEMQLRSMDYCPSIFFSNIEFLLSTPKNKDILCKQRDLLIEINKEFIQYKF